MQCGSGRRRSKKVTRRRGGGYGFNMSAPIGVGAASVTANNTSNVGPIRPGNNEFSTTNLGGRRRKSRKGGRKSRKTRKARRGGGSIATVGQGYTGQGARGLADVTPQVANPPGPVGYMGQ